MNGTSNPWSVKEFETYHLWCCPECDFKAKTKELLIHHGVMQHQQVIVDLS